jgi:hypothetical protein
MLRSSLPLKNDVYGEYSENVADTHKLIASVHLAQGNIEKALRAYKKVKLLYLYIIQSGIITTTLLVPKEYVSILNLSVY